MHVREHRLSPLHVPSLSAINWVREAAGPVFLLEIFSNHIRMCVFNCQDCCGYEWKRADSKSPPKKEFIGFHNWKKWVSGSVWSRSTIFQCSFPLLGLHSHTGSSQSMKKRAARPLMDQISNCNRMRTFFPNSTSQHPGTDSHCLD